MTLDIVFIAVTIVVLWYKFIPWQGCYYNFNAWVITIAVSSLISVLLNLWQMRNLDLKYIWL